MLTQEGVVNPFVDEEGAAAYQAFRPAYHDLPFQRFHAFIGRELNQALDVACGTGHSTAALARIAKKVIGCDCSAPMLQEARRAFGLEFVEARAEDLPFESGQFELINISMGIHWVDQPKFLSEARRVISPGGYLSIDNFGFSGRISQDEEIQSGHQEFLRKNMPAPPRFENYPPEELLQANGFIRAVDILYERRFPMDRDRFCGLLMTQSNYLCRTPQERRGLASALTEFYSDIFGCSTLELSFEGELKLYQLNT